MSPRNAVHCLCDSLHAQHEACASSLRTLNAHAIKPAVLYATSSTSALVAPRFPSQPSRPPVRVVIVVPQPPRLDAHVQRQVVRALPSRTAWRRRCGWRTLCHRAQRARFECALRERLLQRGPVPRRQRHLDSAGVKGIACTGARMALSCCGCMAACIAAFASRQTTHCRHPTARAGSRLARATHPRTPPSPRPPLRAPRRCCRLPSRPEARPRSALRPPPRAAVRQP